jgi:heme/copper-type cytochrome/quinol oxidase subunit 4
MRTFLTQPKVVSAILVLQFIPLLLLPPSSYSLRTQEWWLPLFLTILAVFSAVQVSFRHSTAAWPWSLISFAQGFNIISRLMLIMPHITMNVEGSQVFNGLYFLMTVISITLSAGIIWMFDLPEVKSTYLKA